MASSPDFVAHAIELVALVGPVEARAMFGGHGLYHRGAMFALLDDDELFLKTDAETLPRFVAAGCEPWVWVGPRGPQRTSYYRPPPDAHERAEEMLPWARLAVAAALRARAEAARRAGAKGRGRGAAAKQAPAAKRKAAPAAKGRAAPAAARPKARAAASRARRTRRRGG